MSEPFDPYHAWLGIPAKDQPPHYYRLLGIEPFEPSADVIEAAADRQMAHLRTYQTGTHAELSQDLLNQVAKAKVALLNPAKRAAYDRTLKSELNLGSQAEPPSAVEQMPTLQTPLSGVPSSAMAPRARSRRPPWLVPAAIGAGVLVVVGLLVVLLRPGDTPPVAQGESQRPPATPTPVDTRPAPPDTPAPGEDTLQAAIPGDEPAAADETEDSDPSVPAESETPTEPGEGPPDARGEDSLAELLQAEEDAQLALGNPPAPNAGEAVPTDEPKAPVPDEAAQQKALALIRDVFKADYDEAKTPAGKAALAAKMLRQVNQPGTDDVARFVLLRIARDVAVEAGDVTVALRAIEQMAIDYAVEPYPMRVAALIGAADTATLPEHRRALAERAVPLIREAAARDDYLGAERLAELATRAAQKLRDGELVRQIVALQREVKRIETAYEAIRPALATLKANPNDPEANLAAGQFYCLVKGDWTTGISMLALGGDAPLATLARQEQKGDVSPEEQVALGDAWWDAAQAEKEEAREPLLARAGHWYGRAEPNLVAGLEKTKVSDRLAEIIAADSTPPSSRGPRQPKITRQEINLSVKEHWPFSLPLKKGQALRITATGRWRVLPRGKWHGPDDPEFYLQGRFGDGPPFKVGSLFTIYMRQDAVLHLEMREEANRNNDSGNITVVVEVGELR